MRSSKRSALEQRAQACGIQTSYIDNIGRRQFASEETLQLLLDRIGETGLDFGARMIEPVTVCWQGQKSKLTLRLPAADLREAVLRLRVEDAGEECIPVRELEGVSARTGGSGQVAELILDVPELPAGYHSLSVESASATAKSMLISAPRKIFVEKTRQWGAFLPLYAAHSQRSWGAGNFNDFRHVCEWVGSMGGTVMGTLPLLSAFLDNPICEPSPYSPSSRLFWNEFFIDLTSVPEFQQSAAAKKIAGSTELNRKLAAFRASEFIDYKEQWSVRRRVLEVMAKEFFSENSPRWQRFRAFVEGRPEVEEYARFRALCDERRASWHAWSDKVKAGGLNGYSEEVKQFYLYIQWIAQEQVDQLLRSCRRSGVKFYLDLPLGVNPDGFDAWRYRDFFAPGFNAGAPPDSFFTKGQDWGFAPLHPQQARELKYKYVIDYLRFQMRHTGLLRIDHVMGLHRLWWVPHGCPASAGAYVRYPAEELYAILCLESHRHKTMLVGENLGTVPPEVNRSMDRHGLRRMYVLQYEQQPKGAALRKPAAAEVASINTHDMPSFAAHWKGLDLDDRLDLGLIQKSELQREKAHRETVRKNLITFLRKEKLLNAPRPTTSEVLEAVLQFLARSPAETVLVTIEDLWGEERSQNVPGTSTERPNWRRKASRTIEELKADKKLENSLRRALKR